MTTEPRQPPAASSTVGISSRWRIVGWILFTTALALLAVTVTTRSVLLTQVAERSNASVVQEADEFRTFAAEGVDPATARPFESVDALLERYLARQTPESGEALIGVAGADAAQDSVRFLDNGGGGVGRDLAQDPVRLQSRLDSEEPSGVTDTPGGEMRWGRTTVHAGDQQGTLVIAQFTDRDREDVEAETLILIGVAVGGLALTAGIAWLVAGRILKPLRDIREAAESISASDLSSRVQVTGHDETAHLAHAVNGMLERMQQAQDAQQAFTLQARRHLSVPRDQIARAVTALASEDADAATRRSASQQAHDGLEQMRRTMDALSILARQHSPDFVKRREVSVSEILARAYSASAKAHPQVRWNLADTTEARVWADPHRVVQALNQLTENAATHASADHAVRIGAEERQQDGRPVVSLWVADRGRTLDREAAEQVFRSFQPEDEGVVGMGFGLAVVRAVADAHGGAAWVETDPELGNRFGLDLPLHVPEGHEAAARRLEEDVAASMREES